MSLLPPPRRSTGASAAGRLVAAALAAALAWAGLPSRAHATLVFTPGGFVAETVTSGLPFATSIAFAPDTRMFIALKGGVVRVHQGGALLPTPFLDISASVNTANDRGLLGIALHPDFPIVPYVYLLFSYDPPGVTPDVVGGRVSRLIRVEADPQQNHNVALPGSDVPQLVPDGPGHRVLVGTNSTLATIGNPSNGRDTTRASCMTGLTMAGAPIEDCIPSDEDSHSIGTVTFAPDGSLFLGSGDGANYTGVDHRALRALHLDSLAGKILRIDPGTAEGLPDNPFFDPGCPSCNRSKVYASGLRNPFRFTLHPLTHEPFIGDVGWGTWEEIDSGKGANFGWPCYEGGTAGSPAPAEGGDTTSLPMGSYATNPSTSAACSALYAQGLSAVRAPLFAYNHAGVDGAGTTGGASANAGAFYDGAVYPEEYRSALFILDYNRRWMRYLRFDEQGHATVHNFASETVNGMVQVLVGPDTNLYVVVYAGGTGSEVRRIRYVAGGNTPPTAVASASPTIGTAPLAVAFSSQGSFDPDAQPLLYQWDFGDGDTSTDEHPVHTYATGGVYTATLTIAEATTPFATRSAEVVITVGTEPPLATITAPVEGTTYRIGDVITYSGFGTSGGEPVNPSHLSWELRLHHNEHVHFSTLPGGSGGTLFVDEHGDDTSIDLCLTVSIDMTLTDVRCVSLYPQTTAITLTTDPPGLLVNYEDEGLTQATPLIVSPIVGSVQTVSVPVMQMGLTFDGWADGGTLPSHEFVVGATPATYTARYVNQPPVAVAAAVPTSGKAPLVVAFDGTGSYDPELATLTYDWDFGDGSTSSESAPVHTYPAAGTWNARLTVHDQRNGSASSTVTIRVAACGNGVVEIDERCDGGPCCTGACEPSSTGTVCREAAGPCDAPEHCTGVDAVCPPDAKATGECRAAADQCDAAESCDGMADDCPADGHAADGSGCDDGVACTIADACVAGTCQGDSTTCGNGTTETACGEECDDGNAIANDGCDASCRLEPCGPTPDPACRLPVASGRATLKISAATTAAKRKLEWKWQSGAATAFEEIADPTATADYYLCLYDGDHLLSSTRIPGGGACQGGGACWKARRTGYGYTSRDFAPEGAAKVQVRAGVDGKAKALFKGRGAPLDLPPLGPALVGPLTVQLTPEEAGVCWQAVYGAPFLRNDDASFLDRSD